MDPRLQAGVELTLDKIAVENTGVGMLASSLYQKAAAAGITKTAVETQNEVLQTRSGVKCSPSSAKGVGMEDKNRGYGKGADYKLDDDPSKGKGAKPTGAVQNSISGKNVTTEGSGMPSLEIGTQQHKQASMSSNARVLRTMLGGIS